MIVYFKFIIIIIIIIIIIMCNKFILVHVLKALRIEL
jgi:hypothetical protein